jgi:predicted NAD/FAD-binding protein
MPKVAVVGSGVAGLGAAWAMQQKGYQVELFESADYWGGHTHTVMVPKVGSMAGGRGTGGQSTLDIQPGRRTEKDMTPIDTGFIVCNPITYPNMLKFLAHPTIQVPLADSDMSFAVSRNFGEFEWSGQGLGSVFCQLKNVLPWNGYGTSRQASRWQGGMWRLLWDVIRFDEEAERIAIESDNMEFTSQGLPRQDKPVNPWKSLTLGEFFATRTYSNFFYENYILPMTAAIWSTPANECFDQFPFLTLVRFMRNHRLLQLDNRPTWLTVQGGSVEYVKKVIDTLPKDGLHLAEKVTKIERIKDESRAFGWKCILTAGEKVYEFDHVVFATHADTTLQILGADATEEEARILGRCKFVKNRCVMHRDAKLMPVNKTAWSSWNYLTLSPSGSETKSSSLSLTYWMNKLQPFIPKEYGDVFITLNPIAEPEGVLGEWEYTHPQLNADMVQSQEEMNQIQNVRGISIAGAWLGYGFHEDGLTSGLVAAASIGAPPPFEIILNGGYPTHRVAPPPPVGGSLKVETVKLGGPIWTWKEQSETLLDNIKGKVFKVVGWSWIAAMGLVGGLVSQVA